MKTKAMRNKILIVLLIAVIIALGVLLYMKLDVVDEGEDKLNISANNVADDTMSVVIDEKVVKQSRYAGNKRTIAVMIDNVDGAIPQTGLNDAMIVYEAIVEGGLTRFMAVFKDPKVEDIGPSRSARPYFIDYAMENDSIFVHYGGSPKALGEVKSFNLDNVNGIDSPGNVFWRTNKKKAPHNAIVKVEEVWKYANSKKYRTTTTREECIKLCNR